jgi:3-deoxy-D-manno-octulosonic-acid transferase
LLLLAGLLILPKALYMWFKHGKYKESLFKRLSPSFPEMPVDNRYRIWIHAVSVGETKVAATLVKQLKVEFPTAFIIISSLTETGHAEALKSIPTADFHTYLPIDLSWIINPLVRKIKPNLVILCESDFWYNFLQTAKECGANIALVNGKISEKSQVRFQRFPWFKKKLFSLFDIVCVQSKIYQQRFESLGIPQNKITVTGNMKLDDAPLLLSKPELNEWKQQLGLGDLDQILVVGSTHDPEESLLLPIFKDLWKEYPNLKVLLVPRHPERFNEVAQMIQKHQIPFQRLSTFKKQDLMNLLLIDSMGLLRKCYQMADIALIGGSFTNKVGGHNIIEPSWYGVPVLFGPFMHQQPELVKLVEEYDSGIQTPIENLHIHLKSLLDNPQKRQIFGNAGLKLVSEMAGATERTCQAIRTLHFAG